MSAPGNFSQRGSARKPFRKGLCKEIYDSECERRTCQACQFKGTCQCKGPLSTSLCQDTSASVSVQGHLFERVCAPRLFYTPVL